VARNQKRKKEQTLGIAGDKWKKYEKAFLAKISQDKA
jgi:hypothetical protein